MKGPNQEANGLMITLDKSHSALEKINLKKKEKEKESKL